jgi:RHS repeat-associated protein
MLQRSSIVALTLAATATSALIAQEKPAAYDPNIKVSYVRTWEALAPEPNSANLPNRGAGQVRQATQYADGLGRPFQVVVKGGAEASGGVAKDLVSARIYDQLGREELKFLGYAAPANTGEFRFDPFEEQKIFYQNFLNGQGEAYYYGKTYFEASPLSRAVQSYAAGNSWIGTSRGSNMKYWNNTAVDEVKRWDVTDVPGGFGTYTFNQNGYAAGELFKTISTDEDGRQVIEFKDKDGLVILKKVQFSATADNGSGSAHAGWYCTYYIYDKSGLLRAVVQPKGVEELAKPANSWNFMQNILDELCFRYGYDGSNRMVMKQAPGAKEVLLVYDSRDRVRLTQDANLRDAGKWLYTKYDALNRPVATGLYSSSLNQAQMAAALASSSLGFHESRNGSVYYDYTFDQSFPASSFADVLTLNYYDDYSWCTWYSSALATKDNTYDNLFAAASVNAPYPEALNASSLTKGLVTGTWHRALGTSVGLVTANHYDAKGRIIQVKSNNMAGGLDVLTTQYSFSGQVLHTVLYQNKPGTNSQNHTIETKLEYDNLGRLITVKKKVSTSLFNQPNLNFKTVAAMKYDELGQLDEKLLAPGFNGAELEKLLYDYNIRGWLLGVNRDYAKSTATNRKFGFDLGYDKQSIQPSSGAAIGSYAASAYNGNITGTVWKSAGDGEIRKYDYTYDAVNRLTGAAFKQYTGGGFNTTAGLDFSVSNLTYDANGNIKTMQQNGWKLTGSSPIDNLEYHYRHNELSNQLLQVIDHSNDAQTKLGDFRTSAQHPNVPYDYVYDLNGNMTKDFNKDIGTLSDDGITYNLLNLPQTIIFRQANGVPKGQIDYLYDATGVKLRKTVTDHTVSGKTITTITNYIAGLVYESKSTVPTDANRPDYTDVLQFISHEEGRIRLEKSTSASCPSQPDRFVYDYFIKDHLDNVRIVLTEQSEALCYPTATLEPATVAVEDDHYNIQSNRIVEKSSTGSSDASFDQKLYRVNGNQYSNERTGLGIVLKVMAGDQVSIRAESFYTIPGGGMGSTVNLALADLLQSLAGSAGFPSGKGLTYTDIGNIGANSTALTTFINNSSAGSGKPKAFLNWVLFDERMQYVAGDVDAVGGNGVKEVHDAFVNNPVVASKSGYLYIYVSNETDLNVYFDNLVVTHTPGSILEETHYYPFGLPIAGLSARAATTEIENLQKYTGKELQTKELESGIGFSMYDYGARMYDFQIGRWHVVDPLADTYETVSPYTYALNDPVNALDPDGNLIIFVNGFMPGQWMSQDNRRMVEVPHPKSAGFGGRTGTLYRKTVYTPNPVYRPYPGERTFSKTAPTYLGKMFEYWGNDKKPHAGVGGLFLQGFRDDNARYISASADNSSQAKDRYAEGQLAGQKLIRQLENGEVALADGETIKIVGHSQGAAFAAGIASVLAKHEKYSSRLEAVFYLSPHQPGDFAHPEKVRGYQFSTLTDHVSSDEFRLVQLFNGGSSWAKIKGIASYDFTKRGMYPGGQGGHYVETWAAEIRDFFESFGIKVHIKTQ